MAHGAEPLNLLLQFLYLQILDVLTTMAFLMNGLQEANPIVRTIVGWGPTPLEGLVAVKIFAIVLALICVRSARLRLLAGVNVFFAALVAWNLVVLIIASPARF